MGGLTSRKEQDHVERPFLFRYSAVPLSVSLRRFKSFLRFARSFHLFIGRAQASQTWNAFASASHSRYCYFFFLCVVYMVAAGKLSRARQSPRRLDFPVYLYGAGLQLTLVARCMVSFQQCR